MKAFSSFYLILLSFWSFSQEEAPYVLLISFDGFRHDYVERYETPNFDKFIRNGTAAEGLIPSYPSKTFPNHYTLVTGMYPGNHGLVDNSFYDRDRNVTYTMRERELVEDGYFYGGTPLWQLAQKGGYKSASYFWVGSEAMVAGSYPDYYYKYDSRVDNEDRIKQVGKWLGLKEHKRPRFITLYFSLVDSQGHATGPVSEETGEVVKEADRLLGLVMGMVQASLLPINVIVTSDHGMYQMKNESQSFIRLDEIVDLEQEGLETTVSGTHAHFYLSDPDDVQSFYTNLRFSSSGFRVYLKSETPEHWKYRTHPRVGDVVVTAPLGKVFSTKKWASRSDGPYFGVHGYDPQLTPDMNGIFYANGPNIRQRLVIAPFENIHVFPLIANLLQLETPDNIDGDARVLERILVK